MTAELCERRRLTAAYLKLMEGIIPEPPPGPARRIFRNLRGILTDVMTAKDPVALLRNFGEPAEERNVLRVLATSFADKTDALFPLGQFASVTRAIRDRLAVVELAVVQKIQLPD